MFESKKKETRFEIVRTDDVAHGGVMQVMVDKETGIEYLLYVAYGPTVILDRDGKPKINKEYL